MSRNVDKANSVLVRYQELQAEDRGGYKDYSRYKRPTKVSSVRTLGEAQEWKKQIIRDIKDKTTRIYDPSLNEIQVEELNDQLNDLFKERNRWDWHISHVLGGKHLAKNRRDELVGGKLIMGKRYFGRALELPAVQDLLKQQQEAKGHGKHGKGLVDSKRIPKDKNSIYYGQEKVDNQLEQFESRWTDVLRAQNAANLKTVSKSRHCLTKSDVAIPSIKDVEGWLVERRKKKLFEELNL